MALFNGWCVIISIKKHSFQSITVYCTSTITSVSTGEAGMEGEEAGVGGEKTTKSGHP